MYMDGLDMYVGMKPRREVLTVLLQVLVCMYDVYRHVTDVPT